MAPTKKNVKWTLKKGRPEIRTTDRSSNFTDSDVPATPLCFVYTYTMIGMYHEPAVKHTTSEKRRCGLPFVHTPQAENGQARRFRHSTTAAVLKY